LVEQCLVLVYGLFKKEKMLTFVMVKCQKFSDGAIYIRNCLEGINIPNYDVGTT